MKLIAMKNKAYEQLFWAAYLLILALGIFLRLYNLHSYPCGLAPDEAYNATIALTRGVRLIYPTPLSEVEGFFVSMLSLMFRFWGYGVAQVFMTSSIVGCVTVGLAGIAIKKHFGRWIGLYAMGLLAVSSWHIALSHAGTWIVTTPFFLTLILLAMPRNQRTLSLLHLFGLGGIWGLGFYGYINFRVTIFAWLVACLSTLVHVYNRDKHTRFDSGLVKQVMCIVLGFLAVTWPLWLFYIRNPSVAFARISQVNILSWDVMLSLWMIWANMYAQYVGLYSIGSQNWHHTLDGDPYISKYLFIPFILGLWYCCRFFFQYVQGKFIRLEYRYLFPFFLIFLLPDLFTDSPANGGRLSIELPLVYVMCAIGIVYFVRMFRLRLKRYMFVMLGFVWVALVGYGAWHSFGLLVRQQYAPSHAREYFCDARIASDYLDSSAFLSLLPNEGRVHVYIVGSWYDYAPYDHYLRTSKMRAYIGGIDYLFLDDIMTGQYSMHDGDIVVLPAFSSYKYKRIVNVKDEVSGYSLHTVKDILLQAYPNSKLLYKDVGKNPYWFPEGSSFEVYRYEK